MPTMREKAVAAMVIAALAGCSSEPERMAYWDRIETDPQVQVYVMQQCLTATSGPEKTEYNDWDEAIEECRDFAIITARYCARECIEGETTRADVRAVLPQAMLKTLTEKDD